MKTIIIYLLLQNVLLLLLFAKNKNDGEKELFQRQQWTSSDVVFVILSLTCFLLVLYLLGYNLHHLFRINLYDLTKYYYRYFLISFLTIVLIALLWTKKEGIGVFGLKRKSLIRHICLGVGVALLGYLIHITVLLLIRQIKPEHDIIRPLMVTKQLNDSFSFIIYFLANIFWGPIVEESIYRGILYSPYRKKYGAKIAIILSSLFFSFGHFEVTGESILIGVLWAVLYEKTESIICPIVAHSTHNLFWLLTGMYFLNWVG